MSLKQRKHVVRNPPVPLKAFCFRNLHPRQLVYVEVVRIDGKLVELVVPPGKKVECICRSWKVGTDCINCGTRTWHPMDVFMCDDAEQIAFRLDYCISCAITHDAKKAEMRESYKQQSGALKPAEGGD